MCPRLMLSRRLSRARRCLQVKAKREPGSDASGSLHSVTPDLPVSLHPACKCHSASVVITNKPLVAFQSAAAAAVSDSRRGPVCPQTSPERNLGAVASGPGQEPGHVYVTRKTCVLSLSLTARSPFYRTHGFVCTASPQDGLPLQVLCVTISTWGHESRQPNGLKVW